MKRPREASFRSGRRLLPAVAACCLIAAIAGAEETATRCPSPVEQARLLDDAGTGELALDARYVLEEDDAGALRATVAVELAADSLRRLRVAGAAALCVALILDAEGELVAADQRLLELGDLARATAFGYRATIPLPETAEQILALVAAPGGAPRGAAIADEAATELAGPGAGAVRLAGGGWYEVTRPAAAPAPVEGAVLRLVPPRRQPVAGSTRFEVLAATPAIDRVVFELDGVRVAERRRKPFGTRVELADPPRLQTLRAVAYDAQGRVLGSDTLEVNATDAPFRVRIRELEGDPAAGAVTVSADVTVPAGARLGRVELYRGETLVARFDEAPIRYRVATPELDSEDYLRVAAYLADGSSIDDVVLLAAGAVEEVEVNLVELYVVATDERGQPVRDLRPEEVAIRFRDRLEAPRSFAYADDVSLLLGVVIDTSGSMRLVMHDTRRAAAKFLGTTVLPQDRAFLVDFDREPHLLHPTTADLPALLRDLARLEAEGATAMYDAIVFSMLQFERQEGRKALVVLTDGDDHESRFGPRDCVELGRETGVPIYIIGLGALDVLRRTYSKKDLRRVTEETGGRLYFVDSLEELDAAYAEINAELRSQYALSFYAGGDLDPQARREIEVEIRRPGVAPRVVVGAQRAARR